MPMLGNDGVAESLIIKERITPVNVAMHTSVAHECVRVHKHRHKHVNTHAFNPCNIPYGNESRTNDTSGMFKVLLWTCYVR